MTENKIDYSKREGWELEHTGGGNESFIRDFTTKDGLCVMVFVNELGASIPEQEDGSFKTKSEYVEDYTYAYTEFIDWDCDKEEFIPNENAQKIFTDEQIQEIMETCKQLDLHYQS